MADHYQQIIGGGLRWLSTIVLGLFVGITGFFLLTEHTAHVYGALPYVFLLGCLAMHLFMHGSYSTHGNMHGESGAGHPHSEQERKDRPS